MPPIPPLFKLPIPDQSGAHITCTQPSRKIYLLTFHSPPDNRLTAAFCSTFLLALDIVEHRYPKGVVVSTSSIQKFYSNGLDYENAFKTKGFFEDSLYPVWRRLITYPMPTVALLNGHAFAGGFMLAMYHDYRIMNPYRGYLCLNELEFGAPLASPMASIFRQKLPNPNTFRTMILESKRFNALESLKEGIVDGLGGWEETKAFLEEMKLVGKAESGVYGKLKEEMWRETVGFLDGTGKEGEEMRAKIGKKREEESLRRVEEWERERESGSNGKTKL